MEQHLDSSLPPVVPPTSVTKKLPAQFIVASAVIILLVVGAAYWITLSNSTTGGQSTNAKVSWVSIPPQQKELQGIIMGSSATCVAGTDCQDTIEVQGGIPSHQSCIVDEQCSFFTGFTGVDSGNESPIGNVPLQERGSASSPTNPDMPAAVQGTENCFNKEELLKIALNKSGLREDGSVACECGILPPPTYVTSTPAGIDSGSGEVTNSGTMSSSEGAPGERFICMKPEIRPDIMTENFIFPQSVSINSQFSILFDYQNVGVVGCNESYFHVDVTRTVAGQSESLGGVGAHLLYATPLNPGEGDTFTFGSQLLPPFNLAGDYGLDVAMECEWPRETHLTNNIKKIHIQVR